MMFPGNELPFKREEDKVRLTGPVFLSCGCGQVVARWATVSQNLATKLPQGKPKASKIITEWLQQENLKEKWPVLSQKQYGVVVGETDKGFEMVNIMDGVAMKVAEKVADLIKRSKREQPNHH